MSVSDKEIPKVSQSLKENKSFLYNKEKRESSSEKPSNHFNLKNGFYKIDLEKKKFKNLTILSYITNKTERRFSAKTSLTDSVPEKFDYDLSMVNKYDENLSLSFISDFDLEEEEDDKKDESFDSCENDTCIEEIEIKKKTNKKFLNNIENEERDFELEKEWNDIKNLLLNKESINF